MHGGPGQQQRPLAERTHLAALPLQPGANICVPLPPGSSREGYEEGLSTTHKVLPAAAFIAGDNPIEMLGQYTAIAVEGANSQGALAWQGGVWWRLGYASACLLGLAPRLHAGTAHCMHAACTKRYGMMPNNKSNSTGLNGGGSPPAVL